MNFNDEPQSGGYIDFGLWFKYFIFLIIGFIIGRFL